MTSDCDLILAPNAATLAVLGPAIEDANAYAEASKARTTRESYATDWRQFVEWCEGKNLSALPALPATVAVYLAHLAKEGLAASTVKRAYAGIVHHVREAGQPWPKGEPTVRKVIDGIEAIHGSTPRKKDAITDVEMARVIDGAPATLGGLRDQALLLLGWLGAFRRSALVALNVEDLEFAADGLTVFLRRGKTDQKGRGCKTAIPYQGTPKLCAVRVLQAWLDAAQITTGPIFRAVKKGGRITEERLSDKAVERTVKAYAAAVGLDPARFAGHSLRAGFVTTAARKGKSLDAIMRQTHHASVSVVREYIRHATMFDDNAATGLL